MFHKITLVVSIFMMTLYTAGAQKTTSVAPEAAKISQAVAAPAVKEGWEVEWERVKGEAKKEGRLVLYTTSGPDIRGAITEELKKYGVSLDTVVGRGAELSERILRERRAGIYNADAYVAGLATIVEVLKPAGTLAPLEPLLILPEVKEPKFWYKGRLPFVDKDKNIIAFVAYIDHGIHINTDIIKPGDINSMQDLLSPIWKGKIIMHDPTVAGRGQNFMAVVTTRLGEEYVKHLAKQEPVITRDVRQLIDWIARGKSAISIGVRPEEYQSYKRAGAPVANLLLKDVSYLLGGAGHVAYFNWAPHPNASRVFINWILSREGQTRWLEIRSDQSARLDTPIDHLIKEGQPIRQPDVDYLDVRSEAWELEVRPKALKVVFEAFTPLLR